MYNNVNCLYKSLHYVHIKVQYSIEPFYRWVFICTINLSNERSVERFLNTWGISLKKSLNSQYTHTHTHNRKDHIRLGILRTLHKTVALSTRCFTMVILMVQVRFIRIKRSIIYHIALVSCVFIIKSMLNVREIFLTRLFWMKWRTQPSFLVLWIYEKKEKKEDEHSLTRAI